jgi:hypothetical protein
MEVRGQLHASAALSPVPIAYEAACAVEPLLGIEPRSLGRPARSLAANHRWARWIEIGFKEMGCDVVDLVQVAQKKGHW